MSKKIQNYNDGVVKIYNLENIAAPGNKPTEGLTIKQTLRYEERTVGIKRFYAALQANVKINYVLRCPLLRDVSTKNVAIPNDGKQYRIVQVQYLKDIFPVSMDLTLEEITAVYNIGGET